MVSGFFFKQKTAYELRISDWSSDVCSSDLGDVFRARFIALCVGSLSQPKLPSIEGLADFKGKIFLNSRWDYDYTGGAPDNPQLTNLRDKRVAIVGTGCSAVQAIPHLAEWAKELYMFQRTPSMEIGRASCRERVCQYV